MARVFLILWPGSSWTKQADACDDELFDALGGAGFRHHGLRNGDLAYIGALRNGRLWLIGKLEVGLVCDQQTAALMLGIAPQELRTAPEYVVAARATPQRPRRIAPAIARELRILHHGRPRSLPINGHGAIDTLHACGCHELAAHSAELLDLRLPALQQTALPVRFGHIPALLRAHFPAATLAPYALDQRSGSSESAQGRLAFCHGCDEHGPFLDAYWYANDGPDRHLRLYAAGTTHELPAMSRTILYPAALDHRQRQQIEAQHIAYNRHIAALLRRKGLWS